MENIDKAPRHSLIGTSSPKGSLKFKWFLDVFPKDEGVAIF